MWNGELVISKKCISFIQAMGVIFMALNGTILIIITAVCFGVAAPAAKIAYGEGANPVLVLAVRFSTAAVILWIYTIIRKRGRIAKLSKRQLAILFTTGGIVYFATTILYYNAIIYIPVSLHVIIFNVYPLLINIFSAAVLKEKISRKQLTALLGGFGGIVMMVWSPEIYINWLGVLLSFLSALGNGCYVLMVGNKSIEELDSITVTTYITTSAAVSFVIAGFVTNGLDAHVSLKGLLAVLFVAIFSTVVATITLYLGVKKIGASKASIISNFEPVVGALLGILLLKEKLTSLQVVGAILIIISVVLLSLEKGEAPTGVSAAEK